MNNILIFKYACIIISVIISWSFIKNLIYYLFGVYDIENHNNRIKELDVINDRRKADKNNNQVDEIRELIDSVTAPIVKHVMPNVAYKKDLTSLEKNLKFAGIDMYITPIQYISLVLLGRAVGVFVFIILFPYNLFLAFMWFFGLGILPSLLFKNTVVNKKEQILLGFPEFINISKSYLISGMSFEKAVEESIYYVNREWQELLKKYIINSETMSRKECITLMAEESNSIEVKEFMSLVQLNMEQGIDIKDSFERQYDKIKELQQLAIHKKIEGRKVWTILVQGPVLLTIIVAFGLPIVQSMLGIGSAL